jgi:hypothetical protein
VDESEDDRKIRETLAHLGLGDFFSESSQEVLVDDFGSFRMIPLDSYHEKIEEYDPRNDGYAAKLRSFFVHDGKRFFFKPLEDDALFLQKQLPLVLGETLFKLTVLGQKETFFWYFAFLGAACISALFLSHSRRLFIFQLPVLAAIGWGGPAAIFLAAIMAGIWELLREPLKELFTAQFHKRGRRDYAGAGFMGLKERLRPFKLNLLLVFLFLLFLSAPSIAGVFPALPLLALCLCFFFLYFLSFKSEAIRSQKRQHILFTPVVLLPFRTRTFSLFPFLLPFGAMSILSFFLPRIMPGFSPQIKNPALIKPEYFVSAGDYDRHIAYERSFSYRSLNQAGQEAPGQDDYLSYYLGDDGLISGGSYAMEGEMAAPPFPLEKLMDFLVHYHEPVGETFDRQEQLNPLARLKELISGAIIFAFCMLDFLRPGIAVKKRPLALGDRRIAA